MTLEIKNNQIQIPFAIGQEVWQAKSSFEPEYITCPDCLGEKTLTVIQGNGQKFTVECGACKQGFNPSIGKIQTRQYKIYPYAFTCQSLELHGNTFYYYDGPNNGSPSDRLFASRDECQKKCDELNDEHAKEEERRSIANLESKRRDLAWSVYYWNKVVKELEKDLERARNRLNVCKQIKSDKQ